MQNLSQYVKYTKKFMSFDISDKFLIIEIFILTAVFRLEMLIIPFKSMKKDIGILNEESKYEITDDEFRRAAKIGYMVDKVANKTLWESKCLVRALTAQYLLSKSDIESTLYLGVGKENRSLNCSKSNMIAHAWLRCGDIYVTGGNGKGLAVVAKFKKGRSS